MSNAIFGTVVAVVFAAAPPSSEPAAASAAPSEPSSVQPTDEESEAAPSQVGADPNADTDAVGPAYAEKLSELPEPEQDRAKADEMLAQGEVAYVQGRFDVALDFFVEAYRFYPNQGVLFAVGEAHRALWEVNRSRPDLDMALRRYTDYLRMAPDGGYAEQAAVHYAKLQADQLRLERDAKVVITKLRLSSSVTGAVASIDGAEPLPLPTSLDVDPGKHEVRVSAPGYEPAVRTVTVDEGSSLNSQIDLVALPGAITVRGPKGAEVQIDGATVGKLPLAGPLVVEAGTRFVAVVKNGQTAFSREVEVGSDETVEVRAKLRPTTQRLMSYAFMGLGGAAMATSGVFTGLAFKAQNEWNEGDEKRRTEGNTSERHADRQVRLAEQRDQWRSAAIATGAAGGAVLLTGVVLYAFDRPKVELPTLRAGDRGTPAPELSVVPSVGLDGGGAVGVVRF